MKVIYFVLIATLLVASGLYISKKSHAIQNDTLINKLNAKVLYAIKHSEEIPGLKVDEFETLKTGISKTWNTLVRKGVLEIEGTDKDVRPYFVALQAVVEHVLSCELQKEVKSLKGIIHTPMPATPLCFTGEVSKDLVAPSIENDPQRLFTVKSRTTIVRDFLYKGGYLYIVYPIDGMAKRTDIQQDIYKQELINYPNHLLDKPLNSSSIPDELVGATYLFMDQRENTFAFSIKMTQAKDPKEIGNFALWFGSLRNAEVNKRVSMILDFIKQNDVDIEFSYSKL